MSTPPSHLPSSLPSPLPPPPPPLPTLPSPLPSPPPPPLPSPLLNPSLSLPSHMSRLQSIGILKSTYTLGDTRFLLETLVPLVVFIAALALQLGYYTPQQQSHQPVPGGRNPALRIFLECVTPSNAASPGTTAHSTRDHTPERVTPVEESVHPRVGATSAITEQLYERGRSLVSALQLQQWGLSLVRLVWRFLALHAHKGAMLTLFIVSLSQISAAYLVLLLMAAVASPLPRFYRVLYPVISLYLGLVVVAKMIYQAPLLNAQFVNLTTICNVNIALNCYLCVSPSNVSVPTHEYLTSSYATLLPFLFSSFFPFSSPSHLLSSFPSFSLLPLLLPISSPFSSHFPSYFIIPCAFISLFHLSSHLSFHCYPQTSDMQSNVIGAVFNDQYSPSTNYPSWFGLHKVTSGSHFGSYIAVRSTFNLNANNGTLYVFHFSAQYTYAVHFSTQYTHNLGFLRKLYKHAHIYTLTGTNNCSFSFVTLDVCTGEFLEMSTAG